MYFRSLLFLVHIVCQHCIRNVPNDMDSVLQHCASCYQVDRPDSSYKYVCPLCTRHTSNIAHMRQHIFAHFNVKPFKCTLCEFKCTHSSSLIRHMKLHTGEKPYKCTQCNYACAESSCLKIHVFSKHPNT